MMFLTIIKRPFLCSLLTMLVVSVTILSLVGSQVDSQDLEINLEYRSIQPGEVVRVILKSRRQIKRAYVIFNEEKYEMAKDIDQEAMLAFVGLDLNIKPGTYFIKILVQSQDGNTDHHRKEILVLPKEFPTTKLWVDERFVTPPNEVLERIRRESELIRTIYSVYTPQWLGEGVFILPSSGEPDANFGEKRIFNNKPRSSHSGVDISSPFGAEVIASNSGRILLANDLYFAGKSVIIDHGLGVFSFYCHFSKIIATRGTLVNKGEVIGEVGATGRVTGPHLHWSVRINGSRVDPFSLLSLSWD